MQAPVRLLQQGHPGPSLHSLERDILVLIPVDESHSDHIRLWVDRRCGGPSAGYLVRAAGIRHDGRRAA